MGEVTFPFYLQALQQADEIEDANRKKGIYEIYVDVEHCKVFIGKNHALFSIEVF
jgi:hypothetical protein